MAMCSYYFCLPLLFCGENPAVKIQVNSFYFSTSCCCPICQSCCRKQKIVAEQLKKKKKKSIALPYVILTEFHSSLSQTIKKTALNFHVPSIIFPLSQGSRKSKPPITSCTKATTEQRTPSLSGSFKDLVFLTCFLAFYIAITIKCMARDKLKY